MSILPHIAVTMPMTLDQLPSRDSLFDASTSPRAMAAPYDASIGDGVEDMYIVLQGPKARKANCVVLLHVA